MFCKYLAKVDNLPPTLGAPEEHIQCIRLKSQEWCQANFGSLKYGYYQVEFRTILPVTTTVFTESQAIVELVRCQC